jgi:hypothetical protein
MKKLIIVAASQMIYISKIIERHLRNHFDIKIVNSLSRDEAADMYLIFCIFKVDPVLLCSISDKVIIFQLEQHVGDQISRHYTQMLRTGLFQQIYHRCFKKLEYCEQNQRVLKTLLDIDTTLLPIPIDILRAEPKLSLKTDVLFVGCINEKRLSVLHRIAAKYSLQCITQNVFDTDLIPYFQQSKILLNIHFYDDAILERVRINEGLANGMIVISEFPNAEDQKVVDYYKGLVHFDNDVLRKIDFVLENYAQTQKKHLENLEKRLPELSKDFEQRLLETFVASTTNHTLDCR